jgi:hypothetical protein
MPDAAEQNVSAETLRRIAHDLIRLELTDDEISSLAPVLRDLLDSVDGADCGDQLGWEAGCELERSPRD